MVQGASTLNTSYQKDGANNCYANERAIRIGPMVTEKGSDDQSYASDAAQDTFQSAKVFCHLHSYSSQLNLLMVSIGVFRYIINNFSSLFVALIISLNTQQAHALETRNEILQQIETILSSPELQTAAMKNGKESSVLCSQCHGYDGNSSYPWVPNLASQNPIYFIEQSLKFRQEQRKDDVMSEVIKLLSDQQLVELAVYYSSRSLRFQGNVGKAAIDRGRSLYQRHCIACHGEKGLGGDDKSYAWLAGQQAGYLVRTLTRFRDGSDMRRHPAMANATAILTDAEIASIAAYLSTLH